MLSMIPYSELTNMLQLYMYLCVCLCVFCLSSRRRGGGLRERVIVWQTETGWMKLHLVLLRAFPMFWFALFFYLSKLGFTELFPAMPSNSPATGEPPQTPENDTSNDLVSSYNITNITVFTETV